MSVAYSLPGSPFTLSSSTLAVPHLATRNLARKGALAALQREGQLCTFTYYSSLPLHWCARAVIDG